MGAWIARVLWPVPVICAISLIAACGGGSESTKTAATDAGPRPGGSVVIGSITDVDSWNEYTARQDFSVKLQRRIFLRLARERHGLPGTRPEYEPQLAESWTYGEDGRSLTFRLRLATWSDGRPITAADVRFTWKAQTDADVAWFGSSAKQRVTDVEVVGDRTVTFHFDDAYPGQLADAVEGSIVPEHVFGRVPFDRWRSHDWSAERIGSGPFLLARHDPGHEIVLERNARYYRPGLPRLDRVVVRIVPDSANLITQVLAGDIDYFEGLAPRDAHRLVDNDRVEVLGFDYPKFDYIGWNGAKAPFDDPRVRRALTLAIDRDALVEDLLYGYGEVSHGPLLSFTWAADRELEPWPYAPEEASRILAEAGFATRSGSQAPMGLGRVLEIELVTNAGNALREAMSVKVQEQLGRIGVKVKLSSLEMRAMVGKCMKGDYEAYLGGWTFLGKVDLKPIFGSSSVPPGGANVVAYSSTEVDGMLDGLDRAADWSNRKQMLVGIQRRIHQDQPYTFLYETKRLAVVGSRLRGMRVDDPTDPLARLEQCWLGSS